MIIKVLGGGCKKCEILARNAQKAIDESGVDAVIEKVTDTEKIMSYGVMMTPALVIDEEVKSTGKILKPKSIIELLK